MIPGENRILVPCANLADKNRIQPLLQQLTAAGFKCQAMLGCYVDENRNDLLTGGNNRRYQKDFPTGGVSGFIDADVQCTVADVQRIVSHITENPGIDIIGAPYETQFRDGIDSCGNAIGSKTGLVRVPYLGAGFLFIRNYILHLLEYPYFYRPLVWQGDSCKPEEDDRYFCRKASTAGYKLWADYDIKIKHLTRGEQLEKEQPINQQIQSQNAGIPMNIHEHMWAVAKWYDSAVSYANDLKKKLSDAENKIKSLEARYAEQLKIQEKELAETQT